MEQRKREAPLSLVCAIVDRDAGDRAARILQRRGHRVTQILRGNGTAKPDLLSSLGLTGSRKDLAVGLLPTEDVAPTMAAFSAAFAMDEPGSVAFAVDLSAIGGRKTYEYLLAGTPDAKGEAQMEQAVPAREQGPAMEMVVTIVNRGFSDVVMEAASSAGATGGTILHARGTGVHDADTYFGVSIQPEKELVLILCPGSQKRDIMTAILKGAGLATEGHGLVFALPVSAVAGMNSLQSAAYVETPRPPQEP